MKKKDLDSRWFNYGGDAFSRSLNSKVSVIMRAGDEEEAAKLYAECISRHIDDIEPLPDPAICFVMMTGSEPEIMGAITIEELNRFNSAII